MSEGIKTFRIEYEIPPMRAIYEAEGDALSEEALRDMVKRLQPLWNIRKIYLLLPTPTKVEGRGEAGKEI